MKRTRSSSLPAVIISLALVFFLSPLGTAQETLSVPAKENGQAEMQMPSLAEVYPMAAKLTDRETKLDKEIHDMVSALAIEEKLEQSKVRLEALTKRLKTFKDTSKFSYDQLAELKNAVKNELDSLAKNLLVAINATLARLEDIQRGWGREKDMWKKWEKELPKDIPRDAVLPSFREASKAIDQSLRLLSEGVKPVFDAQRRVGEVQASLDAMMQEIDSLLKTARGELFRKSDPSMLSPRYYSGFELGMIEEVKNALLSNPPLTMSFFAENGWIVVLQVAAFILIVIIIYKEHALLEASTRWHFIWQRPYATGLFFSASVFFPFYGETLPGWRLVLWTSIGVAAVRLISAITTERWHKSVLLILAFLFLSSHFFKTFYMPAPLFRLYVAIVAAAGMVQCFRRAKIQALAKDSPLLVGALRVGVVIFATVLIAQIGGYHALATHLLESSIQSIFLVILVWMFAHLVKGGIEFFLGENSPFNKITLIRQHAQIMNQHAGVIVNVIAGVLSLSLVLQSLRVYAHPFDAIVGVFSLGFTVGEQSYTLGLLFSATFLLYFAFIASWSIQAFLKDEVFSRSHVELGVQISMNRLIHYAVILIGVMVAIAQLGFSLKNISFLVGAFSIGIGFGLQNIVNNFVSGLILLFERPVKVGDVVIIDGEWATIKKMGLRATIVQTYARSEIIVPNSELISTKVTNLTLTDRLARIKLSVGVAYGSDVPRVMTILRELVDNYPLASRNPAGQVVFLQFGESSLDFEIRVWVDVDHYIPTISQFHQQIEAKFREEGIEIPFPQRDLHVRSVDEGLKHIIGRKENNLFAGSMDYHI